MTTRLVVDCATGEATEVELTLDEQAALEQRVADGLRGMTVEEEARTKRNAAQDAIAQHIDPTKPDLSDADFKTAVATILTGA